MGTIVEQGISVAIRKAPARRDHGTPRASSLRVISLRTEYLDDAPSSLRTHVEAGENVIAALSYVRLAPGLRSGR
jgi:hypothetical protein